jgi:hypothetical protein
MMLDEPTHGQDSPGLNLDLNSELFNYGGTHDDSRVKKFHKLGTIQTEADEDENSEVGVTFMIPEERNPNTWRTQENDSDWKDGPPTQKSSDHTVTANWKSHESSDTGVWRTNENSKNITPKLS